MNTRLLLLSPLISLGAFIALSCSLDASDGSHARRMLMGTAPPGTSTILVYDHAGGVWEAYPDLITGNFTLSLPARHVAYLAAVDDGVAKPIVLQDRWGTPRPARLPPQARSFNTGQLEPCDCNADNQDDEIVAENDALDDPSADDTSATTDTCGEGSCACLEGGCDPVCCGGEPPDGSTGVDAGPADGDDVVDDGCGEGTCACAEGTCDAVCCPGGTDEGGDAGDTGGDGEGESCGAGGPSGDACGGGGPSDGSCGGGGSCPCGDDDGDRVTICHATHSESNPYVMISISESAIPAHANHQDGEDIIPAPPEGCPEGSDDGDSDSDNDSDSNGDSNGNGNGNGHDDDSDQDCDSNEDSNHDSNHDSDSH